ncbi:tail fiber protein [Lactobacillus phage Iacchus]|uniref:Tail protein n=1 Tax=Lactobacillus phage Iacchus TaxID=2315483 RepID=A0A3S7UNL1_9CAUD|nr:tail fiber protein [Lactobacillus phage Iacchus]AYH91916.1 tail protein [Lactobacillus phage Iacchus]
MADISIPEGDNPVRYQASLGGNQKYRNMGNVSGQAYLVRGQVTNVYYQKGTLDFNTYGSSVTSGVTDGSGSAPIPVDFWGKNTDGKVFGCYRPVQKGSQILVAYIGGDTSRPIVIGVYPDNEASYELISPVHYNTGDDSTDDVQNDALGERKIYPNQQMMYESGKGDILRSMGGKSFLYISENGSGYLDDINYAYDEISDFYDADANEIEPTMTKAQSWLLVHEDNESDEASDGHRTRFYVNRSGELMVTFANKEDPNNIVVLEASKDSGFKLTKRFDNSNIKEDSEDYVQFGIGNGNNVSIKSVDSGDATSFYLDNGNIKFSTPNKGSITFDGISVNDLLGKVSDAETAANDAGTKADIAASAGAIAQSAASNAASQALAASQAGEDAKSAAVNAQAAGEDAKTQAEDTRNRIIYYSSISNEKDVAIPGKYIIVNTDTYIKNGTIKTAHIGDGAITNAKIANLAVGTAQLEDAAITRAKIGNLAVGTAQIEDAAITDAKVGDLSADHLNAGTIDFSVISGIHINASEIDVGKIVADQIFVNGLGDISKNLGTVTSGKITGTNVNDDINTVQSGVNDLNNPNLMSVIEKQTAAKQFAGLTSQYNVILARAKDDSISTTDLTTAYTNLDNFITPLLKDTTKASKIDRYTYNSLTYAYNTALSNVQAALKDAYNTDISNMYTSVEVASQAASSAAIVASQAATTGDNASHAAEQARIAASQAQSAGNNATSVANNASQAASGAVIAGSQAASNADKAITAASQAKSAGDNATSVANNASQAASGAVIAGSQAAVIANKASTVANEAKSAGDNATSVANTATSVANSAKSTADSTYAYANSEIAVQSNLIQWSINIIW